MHTDFVISARCGAAFRVHKLPLISSSSYFKALLNNPDVVECQTASVKFTQFSAATLQQIINHIYYGRYKLDQETTEGLDYFELLGCADYLDVSGAVNSCSQEIVRKALTTGNWLEVFCLFDAHNADQGMRGLNLFARRNFDRIVEQKYHEMWMVQRVIDFWEKTEFDLYNYLSNWVQAEGGSGAQQLMSQVRYGLMTPTQVKNVLNSGFYNCSIGDWKCLVLKASSYCDSKPESNKVVFYVNDEQNRSRKNADSIVSFAERRHFADISEANPFSGDPLELPFNLYKVSGFHPHRVIPANGYLVLRSIAYSHWEDDRDRQCETWCIYDPRSDCLFEMSSPQDFGPVKECVGEAKIDFGAVYHAGSLYIFGGLKRRRDNFHAFLCEESYDVQRYDFAADTWHVMAGSVLPCDSTGLGVCSLADYIYIAALDREDYTDDYVLYRYNAVSEVFEALEELPEEPHHNEGVQLQTFSKNSIVYLTGNFKLCLFDVDTVQWQRLIIPYVNLRLSKRYEAHMYVTTNCIYVYFPSREKLCMFQRSGKKYAQKKCCTGTMRMVVLESSI